MDTAADRQQVSVMLSVKSVRQLEIVSMNDKEILLAIQELLDGRQWYNETVDQFAMIVERAGYPIRTFGEMGPNDVPLKDRRKNSGQN
jgi:hypothetical protein